MDKIQARKDVKKFAAMRKPKAPEQTRAEILRARLVRAEEDAIDFGLDDREEA